MNTIQILIQYHDEEDVHCNEVVEMEVDDLRAVARYLSSIRIVDIPLDAIVPMRNLYDKIVALDKTIKQL